MAYADVSFYTGDYGGTLSADSTLNALLAHASDDIDRATCNRIGALGGLAALTPFCRFQIQMAVCAQADYLHATDGLTDLDSLKSYQIGNIEVTFGGDAIPTLGRRARDYLMPTMLLFRRI